MGEPVTYTLRDRVAVIALCTPPVNALGARVRAAAARHGVGAQPQVWREPPRPGVPVADAQDNDGWRSSVRGTDGRPPRQDVPQGGAGGWRSSSRQAAPDGVQLAML